MASQNASSLCLASLLFFLLSLSVTADDAAVMAKLSSSLTPTPSDWKTTTDPCSWSGVKCDGSNHIISVDLSSLSLSGTLPSDLNQLSHLQNLNLQHNSLSGPLPSLSSLSFLKEMLLDNNKFTSIPSDFFTGLTNLQTVSLNDNPSLSPWTISSDLSQSTSLQSFIVSNASITGSIPDFFNSFPNLQNLRLSYNNLTGSLPRTFAGSEISNLWLNNQKVGFSERREKREMRERRETKEKGRREKEKIREEKREKKNLIFYFFYKYIPHVP